MQRYRSEIEADLQAVYNLDLGAEWRARRWRKMLNLIDHLPSNSHTRQAFSQDEEHVAMIQEAAQDRGADTAPPASSWSPEVDMLARVVDEVRGLTLVQIAKGGGTPPKLVPVERPFSAFKGQDHKKRTVEHEKLVARVKAAKPAAETDTMPEGATATLFKQ